MTKLIITVGLPASSKTTWAKKKVDKAGGGWKIVCMDDLRAMLDNGKYTKNNEKAMKSVRDVMVVSLLESGFNIIIADTNLSPKVQDKWRRLAKSMGVEFEKKSFLDISLETCIKRDLQREKSVGKDVIMRMYKDHVKPLEYHRQYEPDDSLPQAILVDLDGTLAHNDGVRGWYDWKSVGLDSVDPIVAEMVRMYHYRGFMVVIMSGRDAICREETSLWLKEYNIPCDRLFMRGEGDQRKDVIVKKELFFDNVADDYNVKFALDDRDQIVEGWRDIGLKCLQVAEGDF